MTGWSVCPACSAVVDDPQVHQDWHATITGLLAFLANVQPPEPTTTAAWAGEPVPPPPPAPSAEELVEVAAIRAQVPNAAVLRAAVKPALDAFAAAAAADTLDGVALLAHIPVLNAVANGLLDYARDTACVLTRTPLEET